MITVSELRPVMPLSVASAAIHVFLALLMIFLIVQPRQLRSIDVQLPAIQRCYPLIPMIVLEITADGKMNLNNEHVGAERLEARLRGIYTGLPDRLLFVTAADNVLYQQVITALDTARGAGIVVFEVIL